MSRGIVSEEPKQAYGQLRIKLDCSIMFDDYMNVLTTLQVPYFAGYNFMFGSSSSINYCDCMIKAQLIEVWKSAKKEADADYVFKFLYAKS
jgi:hypothetical protein